MSENNDATASADRTNGINDERDDRVRRALLWIGAVSAVSAVAAFVVVRATVGRSKHDPTGERIQSLIDEANTLLKQLDQKK